MTSLHTKYEDRKSDRYTHKTTTPSSFSQQLYQLVQETGQSSNSVVTEYDNHLKQKRNRFVPGPY